MVQVWSMLAAQDAVLGAQALRSLPPAPAGTAWVTYLRGHDDIGWAVSDADAGAVGLSGPLHREFLSDWYSGAFPGTSADGLVFQENPATGDRRISGTTPALAGLSRARSAGASPEAVSLAVARVLLGHALVLGWGGVPVLWSGDELALGNDPHWAEEPGHAADNRWAHRPRLPDAARALRHDPASVEGRVFAGLRHLTAVRAGLPHLHAGTAAEVLDLADPGVLPVLRRHPVGPLVGLYNVTGTWRPWSAAALGALGVGRDVLAGAPPEVDGGGWVWLPPYTALWLV
jgi:amylosucrase